MARANPRGWLKACCFSLAPAAMLLAGSELLVRVGYWARYGRNAAYLLVPLGPKVDACSARDVTVYSAATRSFDQYNAATQRMIHFSVNRQLGRGEDWRLDKPDGAVRILALGGSSTFGVGNPDEATWPARLEQVLRQRAKRPIEVLNGGRPGGLLGVQPGSGGQQFDLFRLLRGDESGGRDGWLEYKPDIVLYYEAFNNTPRTLVEQVHALHVPG